MVKETYEYYKNITGKVYRIGYNKIFTENCKNSLLQQIRSAWSYSWYTNTNQHLKKSTGHLHRNVGQRKGRWEDSV